MSHQKTHQLISRITGRTYDSCLYHVRIPPFLFLQKIFSHYIPILVYLFAIVKYFLSVF